MEGSSQSTESYIAAKQPTGTKKCMAQSSMMPYRCLRNTKEMPKPLEEKVTGIENLHSLKIDECASQPATCQPQQVFVTHPDVAAESRPDCFTRGLEGYGRPFQHPLYVTRNSDYGRYAPPPALQVTSKHARCTKFSKTQALGGSNRYVDMNLNP